MSVEPSYSLSDPRPRAQSARYTFFLPSAAEIAAIGLGDHVKLTFDYPHHTERWSGERMWVTVKGIDGDTLFGDLASTPDEPTSPLKPGQRVECQRFHVLAIDWSRPDSAPPPEEYREYWDRCLVDACVLDGEEPVEFLYREEPDMAQEGDGFPDSGWRIRGRMDDTTGERVPEYVALGAVLNQDDSWLHLIDAPVGSAFLRDFQTDTYHAEGPVVIH